MSRPRGSIIGAKPAWTTTSTSGIWPLRQAEEMLDDVKWPRGPVAPTSLAGTGADAEVALTWTAPATTHGTITNYAVEYTPSGGSATVVLTDSTAESYTVTGLTNDTEYTFRVAAINHTQGEWSTSVSATPAVGGGSITPGNLYGWGDNDGGQLGDGSTTDRSYTLGAVDSNSWIAAAISIEAYGFGLAIKSDGTLYSAGYNFYGSLADGTTTNRSTFGAAAAGSWLSCAAGSYHSLLVKSDNTLHSVGYNPNGQLGDGSTTDSTTLAQVGSDTDWAAVYAARYSSYAIKSDGTLYAWGDNTYGQLGDGSTTSRNSPVQVGSAAWTKITANQFHALGLQSDGTLWAWGTNGNRFGDGGTNNSTTPVQIGSDTWIDIAAGRSHSVGIKSDGTLWGWGYSTNGAHGSGTATLSSPTQIGSASTWAKVAAGNDHSAAIDSSGIRYLFGSSANNRSSGATTPTSAGTDIWSLIVTQGTSSLGIAVAP